jgi:hypothetical protein
VFVTGSTLNKLFNPTGQVSKADYYNETDPDYVNQKTKLPLGFHYLDDSANSGYSGFPVFLDTNLDSSKASALAAMMKEGFFLDEYTTDVKVLSLVYNPQLSYFGVASVDFTHDIHGYIDVSSKINVFSATLYPDTLSKFRLFCEVVLAIVVFASCCQEVGELANEFRATGSMLGYFRSTWNYLDVANLVCLLLLIVHYVYFATVLAVNFSPPNDHTNVYHDLSSSANFLRYRDDNDMGMRAIFRLFADAEKCALNQNKMNNMATLSMTVMTLRTMKVLDFSPRIGLVTRTISRAAVDLCHFFVIFFILVGGFSVVGWLNFGADIQGFATLPESVYTIWMWLNGDFSAFDAIRSQDTMAASGLIFFCLFQAVVFFVLLNILLAIICDCYAEVKEETGDAATMPSEISRLIKGLWRSRSTGASSSKSRGGAKDTSQSHSSSVSNAAIQAQLTELLRNLNGEKQSNSRRHNISEVFTGVSNALHSGSSFKKKPLRHFELQAGDTTVKQSDIQALVSQVRAELRKTDGKSTAAGSDADLEALLEAVVYRMGDTPAPAAVAGDAGGIETAKVFPDDQGQGGASASLPAAKYAAGDSSSITGDQNQVQLAEK